MPPGRVPKHPEERRNRAKPRAGEWVDLPAEGRKGPVPPVPKGALGAQGKAWWKTVWKSPMATMWTEEDIPALLELAVLREQLMFGKVSVAPEVRLRSGEFGLTPKGRQDRRWRIVTDTGEMVEPKDDEFEKRRTERRTRLAAGE